MRNALFPLVMTVLSATAVHANQGHSDHVDHSTHETMHQAVQAEATINSIDGDTVNLSHGPIPAIGWPAMTMDLRLLEGAETGDVTEGQSAIVVLEKAEDGMYAIRALKSME